MKALRIAALSLVAGLAGCGKPERVVVLDVAWNVDTATNACAGARDWLRENEGLIARFGCDRLLSCRPMTVIADACLRDPVQQVREFEAALAAQFARTSECGSVRLVDPANPRDKGDKGDTASDAVRGPHWSLGLDFSPGARRQPWTMFHTGDPSLFAQGEGEPEEIAARACTAARDAATARERAGTGASS